jgi:hypothetical protein
LMLKEILACMGRWSTCLVEVLWADIIISVILFGNLFTLSTYPPNKIYAHFTPLKYFIWSIHPNQIPLFLFL